MTPKQKIIGEYLNKKMKGHGLLYGMQYLSLLATTEAQAEVAWKAKRKKAKKLQPAIIHLNAKKNVSNRTVSMINKMVDNALKM